DDAPVLGVLGRVEVQGRPHARERELGDGVLLRGGEVLDVGNDVEHRVVGERGPKAVVLLAAGDGALRSQLVELLVRARERLALADWVEVVVCAPFVTENGSVLLHSSTVTLITPNV